MTRGFTLVEILIVLVILGVLASVSVPAFGRFGSASGAGEAGAAAAAYDLLRVLSRARETAARQATDVTLILDRATGRYWVRSGAGEEEEELYSGAIALGPGDRVLSPERRPRFRFGPVGLASGDPVVVESPAGRVAVTLDPWTGRPHATPR